MAYAINLTATSQVKIGLAKLKAFLLALARHQPSQFTTQLRLRRAILRFLLNLQVQQPEITFLRLKASL